jgi:transposase
MVVTQLEAIDELTEKIEAVEKRIQEQIAPSAEVKLLLTMPGVGEILAPVIWLEIGDVNRFPRAEQLASYAGLVPRVISSGERMRLGSVSRSVNQYLKWAFVEAATCAVKLEAYRSEHIGRLYRQLCHFPTQAGPFKSRQLDNLDIIVVRQEQRLDRCVLFFEN